MNVFSERVPPQNLEAEQSVLGAMLIDREAVIAVANKLVPEDFYSDRHQHLYAAMMAIYNRGEPVDPITVQDELNRMGKLEEVGGLTYLTSLINLVPTTANVLQYAEIVEAKATLRRLQTAARRIVDECYTSEDVETTLQEAEKSIFAVTQRRSARGYQHIRDALVTAYGHLEHLYTSKGRTTGVPSGYRDLDAMTSGFQPSDLIIVAARPSVGKTAFTLNIARNAAVQAKAKVIFFSLEMSAEQLALRLLASEATVDGHKLRTGQLQDQDWHKLGTALSVLGESDIFIDDTPNIPLQEMRAKSRRIAQEHGLDLIIVDYLQLMSLPQRPGQQTNRQQEISEISRSLKALARELKVPVIALSQLSRSVEQRQDKRPMLSDLRECLTGDTLVSLASGDVRPIADLVGEQPDVVTLDGWRMTVARATRVWKVGTRPVYRLTTRTGRVIRATANHPFRQLHGWTALRDLKAGDRIAIPRSYPDTAGVDWDDEHLILLAHLIGDGSYIPRQPLRYYSSSEENLKAVAEATEKCFGIRAKPSRVPGSDVLLLSAGANKHHPVLASYAAVLEDPVLEEVAAADVSWDEVVSIEPDGEADVYDMSVPGTNNFVANGIVVHNSGALEQDADMVAFLYREDYYDQNTDKKDMVEVILAKHRNGPIGTVELYFAKEIQRMYGREQKRQ